MPELPKGAGEMRIARLDRFRYANGGTPTADAAPARCRRPCRPTAPCSAPARCWRRACARSRDVWTASDDIRVTDRSLIWNTDLIETLEFDNLIVAGGGHRGRRASRAGEPRRACARGLPKRDDVNWMKHTLSWADYADARRPPRLPPVHSLTLSNEIAYIEPKERV